MLSFVPEDVARVLEIGCGAGTFGELLKSRRAMEVVGVEPVTEAADMARSRLDRVLVEDIELCDLDLPLGYFDAAIFNDVLEHLRDPWDVLSRMRRFIRPDGYVIASIPNMRYFEVIKSLLVRAEWHYADEGVLDRSHLRFFTKKSMHELFSSTGFNVISLEGIRESPFPWKFALLNFLLADALNDMRFERYACVAQIRTA